MYDYGAHKPVPVPDEMRAKTQPVLHEAMSRILGVVFWDSGAVELRPAEPSDASSAAEANRDAPSLDDDRHQPPAF